MKKITLYELQKKCEEIRELEKNLVQKEVTNQRNKLLDEIDTMVELSVIGRKEGLLALEEKHYEYVQRDDMQNLSRLIMLMVDGTDPELIAEVAWSKYFADNLKAYEGLKHIIQLEGILAIAKGVNPRLLEEKMKSLLPKQIEALYIYRQKIKEEQEEAARAEQEHKSILDRPDVADLISEPFPWEAEEAGYYVMKLLDHILCEIDDRSLQRLLREVDNADLELVLKGVSGQAKGHVFKNLSYRLAEMIIDDMNCMYYVNSMKIIEAGQKTISIILRLMSYAEIGYDQFEVLKPLFELFYLDVKQEVDKCEKADSLEQLLQEYKSMESKKFNKNWSTY